MVLMTKHKSLVYAKARLSQLVDEAEHHGVSTVILRHGKPSAVIVPVTVGAPKRKRPKVMTQAEIDAMRAEAALYDNPEFSAVQDTIDGRR
jgi:prevent-host-death family protein